LPEKSSLRTENVVLRTDKLVLRTNKLVLRMEIFLCTENVFGARRPYMCRFCPPWSRSLRRERRPGTWTSWPTSWTWSSGSPCRSRCPRCCRRPCSTAPRDLKPTPKILLFTILSLTLCVPIFGFNEGCQIFLGATYQRVVIYMYQCTTKYIKCPQNILNVPKI
jgi:hypothetical protein